MRDIDPENFDFHEDRGDESENSDADQEEIARLARSHYLNVGQSSMRADSFLGGDGQLDPSKYSTRSASRLDIYSDNSLSTDGEQQLEVDQESSDESASESEGEKEEIIEELQVMAREDSQMIKTISDSAASDAQKGEKVKNQLSIFESLLASRIKTQQCLNIVNSSDSGSVDLSELGLLVDKLLDLKSCLLSESKDFSDVQMAESRKSHSGLELLRHALNDNQSIDSQADPVMDSIFEKWNRKVNIRAGIMAKNLKAINQSVVSQIHSTLESDRDRLVARTRINRSNDQSSSTSDLIFDDNDFYQTLLREFIESKSIQDPTETGRQWAKLKSMQKKKHREGVDQRASKGRKLRYDVHEKLENFMVPVEMASWHDEMTSELLSTLPRIYSC